MKTAILISPQHLATSRHKPNCIGTVWRDVAGCVARCVAGCLNLCGEMCGEIVLNLRALRFEPISSFCGEITSINPEKMKIITHLSTSEGNYLFIFISGGICRVHLATNPIFGGSA